jgi:hypothetical protein
MADDSFTSPVPLGRGLLVLVADECAPWTERRESRSGRWRAAPRSAIVGLADVERVSSIRGVGEVLLSTDGGQSPCRA